MKYPIQPTERAKLPDYWRATAKIVREVKATGPLKHMTPEQAYAHALENAAAEFEESK